MLNDSTLIGIAGIVVMLVLIAARLHIGLAMMAVAFGGAVLLRGWEGAMGLLATTAFQIVSEFSLVVVPLFILMGLFVFHSGLGEALYSASHKWLGKMPGGLAIATCMANAAFGAVSGSTVAAAAFFSKTALPEMVKYGYNSGFAAGVIMAAGTFASLIPPSVVMVFYCLLTGQSIGRLFMAGVIPGLMLALSYSIFVSFRAKMQPTLAPPLTASISLREKVNSLKDLWGFPIIVIAVLGGIYTGMLTAIEAAAVGAVVSFLLMMILQTKGRWAMTRKASVEGIQTTCMIFFILIGAILLSRFTTLTGIPQNLVRILNEVDLPRLGVFAAIVLMYVVLGMFLDVIGMLAITLPIVYPVVTTLGFDPIWFGIMCVLLSEIALITPPIGMNLFVVLGATKGKLDYGEVLRSTGWYVAIDLLMIGFLTLYPQIVLWLPDQMIK